MTTTMITIMIMILVLAMTMTMMTHDDDNIVDVDASDNVDVAPVPHCFEIYCWIPHIHIPTSKQSLSIFHSPSPCPLY